jgi:hypothetical protein
VISPATGVESEGVNMIQWAGLTPDLTTRDLWRSRRWARERGNLVYSSLWEFKSSFTCRKILHGTFPLYFPSERKVCCGFLSPWPGFEPATFGSSGHGNFQQSLILSGIAVSVRICSGWPFWQPYTGREWAGCRPLHPISTLKNCNVCRNVRESQNPTRLVPERRNFTFAAMFLLRRRQSVVNANGT